MYIFELLYLIGWLVAYAVISVYHHFFDFFVSFYRNDDCYRGDKTFQLDWIGCINLFFLDVNRQSIIFPPKCDKTVFSLGSLLPPGTIVAWLYFQFTLKSDIQICLKSWWEICLTNILMLATSFVCNADILTVNILLIPCPCVLTVVHLFY